MDAHYRKINDKSKNSSKYHKKDGTNVRAKLKRLLDIVDVSGNISPKEMDKFNTELDKMRNAGL